MPLVLIKEDGTGKLDANSYASAADGDAYHDGHLYASAWTAATTANKEKALVMATRLIDGEFRFNGYLKTETQALQWPRTDCPDPDRQGGASILLPEAGFVPSNVVPTAVAKATCEMARALLISDRSICGLVGEGVVRVRLADGSETVYSKRYKAVVITCVAEALLSKYGAMWMRAGAVALVRA